MAFTSLLERLKRGLAKAVEYFQVPRGRGGKSVRRSRNGNGNFSLSNGSRRVLAKMAQLFNIRSWFGRKVDQAFLDSWKNA